LIKFYFERNLNYIFKSNKNEYEYKSLPKSNK
jgi:hypothetical protein